MHLLKIVGTRAGRECGIIEKNHSGLAWLADQCLYLALQYGSLSSLRSGLAWSSSPAVLVVMTFYLVRGSWSDLYSSNYVCLFLILKMVILGCDLYFGASYAPANTVTTFEEILYKGPGILL